MWGCRHLVSSPTCVVTGYFPPFCFLPDPPILLE
jgi:hypothetical protein